MAVFSAAEALVAHVGMVLPVCFPGRPRAAEAPPSAGGAARP